MMKNICTAISNLITGKTVSDRQARVGYLFVLPTFLYVLIIFFMPAGYTILLSIFSWSIRGMGRFVGLESYIELFKDALFGAVFTAVAWEIAKLIFTFYITQMVDYSRVFGSLSTLVVIFLWIYYSAYIFLFGAELSYVYARRKHLKQ